MLVELRLPKKVRSTDIFIDLQIKNTWSLRNDAVFDPKHKCQTKIKQKENPGSCKSWVNEKNAKFGNWYSEFGSVSGQNAKPFSFHFMAQTIDNFRLFHFFSLINLMFSATENQSQRSSVSLTKWRRSFQRNRAESSSTSGCCCCTLSPVSSSPSSPRT